MFRLDLCFRFEKRTHLSSVIVQPQWTIGQHLDIWTTKSFKHIHEHSGKYTEKSQWADMVEKLKQGSIIWWIVNRTEKEKSHNEQKIDVFSLDLKMLTELTSWMCSGWLFQRIGALWATTLPPEELSKNQGTVKAKLFPKCNWGFFYVNVYESNLHVKAWLRRKRHFSDLPYFRFWVKLIFNGSATGTLTIASKSLFLKQ